MPSPENNILQAVTKAVQYTGSNSADIDSQVPGVSITSEVDGVLTLNGGQHVLNTNDWIVWNAFQTMVLSSTTYATEWGCVALCSDVEELQGDITALSNVSAVRAMGVAPVPSLPSGQDTTVAVPIQPAMPDSGYTAYAATFGGVNLGDLSITSVSVVDTDTVNVAVDNVGLGTVSGVTIMVHAVD